MISLPENPGAILEHNHVVMFSGNHADKLDEVKERVQSHAARAKENSTVHGKKRRTNSNRPNARSGDTGVLIAELRRAVQDNPSEYLTRFSAAVPGRSPDAG